ncbi:MAG: peptide chain release factor 2 [Candidatus Doudnabacteria bacterium]|nr:peptide chain release factor 2 [Candidatus Doudnabacteria bacterium]
MQELIKRAEFLINEIIDLKKHLNLPQKEQRILELEDKMQAVGFWADNQAAQKIVQEHSQLKKFYNFWQQLQSDAEFNLEMLKSENQQDKFAEADKTLFLQEIEKLEKAYKQNRLVALLSKKYDDHCAIFSVHSGAGGVDAQDWAEMLLRMFLRFADKKGFVTEILELNKGSEGGVKSAVVTVRGPFAYGFFKSEAGVHRLVRLSPFNPAHTRETSFALMELLPELEEQEELKIDPKELKIEANTASGHGGQSVNTTYSAIRITHLPTGLKVSIQNERSQHQNRELAMKILMSKLRALEEEKLQKEKLELRGEFKSAEWGNQIRSYVIHPYKLVKDHRTGFESTNPDEILDGNLDEFVEKYLESIASS